MNDVIKKPYLKSSYNSEQLEQLARCVDDPIYFIENFVKVQHPTKGLVPLKLYPFQKDMVLAFAKNRFVIGTLARQMGKALALDTPIPTPTGWTTMGEIKVGDYILGADENPCKVSFATDVMYGHDCFEVEFDNGDIITADAEHLWKVHFAESTGIANRETISTVDLIPLWQQTKQDVSIIGKNNKFYIHDIRKCPSVPVKCIQVDNDSHMFLCGKTMIPTHNTTCAAAYILWKTTFTPDFVVLITGNIFSASIEVSSRIHGMWESLPDFIRAGAVEYNKSSVVFDNGSRIISRATTPHAGRGLSISLLYSDEFAFVAPSIARDFWTAITPTLSTGGACIITSTPRADIDQFSQIWKAANDTIDEYGNQNPDGIGVNGFFPINVTWDKHPDRDEAWATEFRNKLGEARFQQEFENKFVTDDETLINALYLSRMKFKEPLYYTGTVRWYEEPQPNRTYIAALDPSMGTGYDFSTIQVFEAPSMRQVAEWQHNHTDPKGQVRMMMQILMIINQTLLEHPEQSGQPDIFWTVENNSLGEAVLQIIDATGEEKFPGVFVSEKRKKGTSRRFRKGMNTDNRKKYSACARFKTMIESGRCQISSQNLINELKVFVRGGGSFKAKQGEHDDLVMSTLLCIRMLETVTDWLDDSKANQLREIISEDDATEPMPMSF